MHGNGRGTRLCTCLVDAACVVAFDTCVNGDEFSAMYLVLVKSVVRKHGRGMRLSTCLVEVFLEWVLGTALVL